MTGLTRRRFLHIAAVSTLASSTASILTACEGIQPQPFVAGAPISAPMGCKELLTRDKQGDC